MIKKDVKFLYHGNSKVAIVNGSYQVHLMTYIAKGSPRRDLCVYLTQEEYEALENHIPDINHERVILRLQQCYHRVCPPGVTTVLKYVITMF